MPHARTPVGVFISCVLLAGCAGEPDAPLVSELPQPLTECVDRDGDGYGRDCAPGPDCDDMDPGAATDCVQTRTVVPCTDGETRECRQKLPEHNGVANCLVGVEVCVAGVWSDCMEGHHA